MKPRAAGLFVVISGIPGSGKTTLGRELAAALGLPFYDKDDILGKLFEREGVGDLSWRKKLSRKSDEELVHLVTSSTGAVVVSFWQTKMTGPESGTPVEWIRELHETVVEIHCTCDPAVAAARFNGRLRHPGHLDGRKPMVTPAEFERLADAGPLGLGKVLVADTSGTSDIATLVAAIRQISITR